MRFPRTLVLIAAAFAFAAPAAAEDAAETLKRFFGSYMGESLYPREEARTRELSVAIRPAEDDGFIVEWQTTFYKFRKEPRRKTQALEFRPSGPGKDTYVAVSSGLTTGMEPSRDPLSGAPFAWARILENLLTVNVLFINDEGDYVIQTYDRALTKDGMGLSFMRVRNGHIEQRLWATLERVGE